MTRETERETGSSERQGVREIDSQREREIEIETTRERSRQTCRDRDRDSRYKKAHETFEQLPFCNT
jgi:hypothetical protein